MEAGASQCKATSCLRPLLRHRPIFVRVPLLIPWAFKSCGDNSLLAPYDPPALILELFPMPPTHSRAALARPAHLVHFYTIIHSEYLYTT